MGEFDEGKEKFLQVVKSIDPSVEVVMPVTPSRGIFLISFTKAGQRKFLTVSEDDILDLPEDPDILKKVTGEVQGSIAAF
jgi:hypothetical protein